MHSTKIELIRRQNSNHSSTRETFLQTSRETSMAENIGCKDNAFTISDSIDDNHRPPQHHFRPENSESSVFIKISIHNKKYKNTC